MRRVLSKLLALSILACALPLYAAEEPDRLTEVEKRLDAVEKSMGTDAKPTGINVYWKEGLKFDSNDGNFKLQIGGRLMNDWLWWKHTDSDISAATGESFEDGTEFRRARLFVAGAIYENVNFKAQYDFAGGEAVLKDAYVELTSVPHVGNVQAGHFKEPMGLEELTSSKYITFMERSLPMAFVPSRNTGIMIHDAFHDDRATWAVGVFRDADDFGSSSSANGNYNVTGRITTVPWQDKDANSMAHVGASYSVRSPLDDTVRFRQRPEVHISSRWVDTGSFAADGLDVAGLEGAVILGATSFQAEYVMASADGPSGDGNFSGWYVAASHFLTGEHRPYKKASFSRVKPAANFSKAGGRGAWEVAARYSAIDLSDGAITGGELSDITLGLNWYLNPNTRVMWNYIHGDLDGAGDADSLGMRFQVDF